MEGIDLLALAMVVVMAVLGARRGLIASVLSLAAVATGAVVGSRLAPHILNGGSHSPYTPLAGVVGALAFALLLQMVAGVAGGAIRNSMRLTPFRRVDSAGGLVFGALTALAFAWVVAVAVLLLPGQANLRDEVRGSAILSRLVDAVPPRPILNALASIDPFPYMAGPRAPSQEPDPLLLRSPVIARVQPSVVRIEALACGIGYTGTGWVVKPGIVVTAAHVVAGAKWVVITEPEEGKTVAATPIVFDGHNDLALLRAAPLAALPLPLGDAVQGSSGIALGYPAGGGFHAAAARIGETQNFLARDYRDSMVVRKITSIRADIRPGNSGGPLISRTGVVEGTVFARKQGDDVGYVVPTSVLRTDLAKPREPVSTGSCIG